MLRQIGESDFLGALANHQVDSQETLEHNGPCRIPQAVVHRPKDLADPSLSRVRSNQKMLDVLCFWGRILQRRAVRLFFFASSALVPVPANARRWDGPAFRGPAHDDIP